MLSKKLNRLAVSARPRMIFVCCRMEPPGANVGMLSNPWKRCAMGMGESGVGSCVCFFAHSSRNSSTSGLSSAKVSLATRRTRSDGSLKQSNSSLPLATQPRTGIDLSAEQPHCTSPRSGCFLSSRSIIRSAYISESCSVECGSWSVATQAICERMKRSGNSRLPLSGLSGLRPRWNWSNSACTAAYRTGSRGSACRVCSSTSCESGYQKQSTVPK